MRQLLLIVLTTILVSIPVHGAVIRTSNGVIDCDGVICPEGSTSCTVTQRTFGDLTQVNYIRLCTDASGVPTHSVQEEIPNPYPGTVINTVSTIGGARVLSEEERKEIDEKIGKVFQDTTNYWNKWSSDFTADLKKSFPPSFPFHNFK